MLLPSLSPAPVLLFLPCHCPTLPIPPSSLLLLLSPPVLSYLSSCMSSLLHIFFFSTYFLPLFFPTQVHPLSSSPDLSAFCPSHYYLMLVYSTCITRYPVHSFSCSFPVLSGPSFLLCYPVSLVIFPCLLPFFFFSSSPALLVPKSCSCPPLPPAPVLTT